MLLRVRLKACCAPPSASVTYSPPSGLPASHCRGLMRRGGTFPTTNVHYGSAPTHPETQRFCARLLVRPAEQYALKSVRNATDREGPFVKLAPAGRRARTRCVESSKSWVCSPRTRCLSGVLEMLLAGETYTMIYSKSCDFDFCSINPTD